MKTADAKQSARLAKTQMYRQLVIDAAEAQFAAHGFDDTKIQDIAKAAGIALGTLYGVFPGKAEIYAEIQRIRGHELLAYVARNTGAATALDACVQGLEAYVHFMVSRLDYLRMHLREGLSWSERVRLTGEEAVTWEQGMSLSEGLFQLGIDQGALYPGEPQVLVRMMTAAHQVQLKDWVFRGADMEEVATLTESMREHFLRAFVRPEAAEQVRHKSGTHTDEGGRGKEEFNADGKS